VTAQNTPSDKPRIDFYDHSENLLESVPMRVDDAIKADLVYSKENVASIINSRGILEKMTRLENPYCSYSPGFAALEYSDADLPYGVASLFEALDKDGSGRLSTKEFMALSRAAGGDTPNDKQYYSYCERLGAPGGLTEDSLMASYSTRIKEFLNVHKKVTGERAPGRPTMATQIARFVRLCANIASTAAQSLEKNITAAMFFDPSFLFEHEEDTET